MNDHTTNLPAQQQRRELAPIEVIKNTLARKADDFKMVLPSHITVDKFQRTIATAALSNPQLLTCDRQSLLIAAMKLAQDGLLPDGREAALVPFKVWSKETRQTTWQVQAMPMAWGVRKKILQSGQVVSLETGLVYRAEMEAGNFIYEIGMDPPIRHRPKLDMTDDEMADDEIVAAYSIARLKNEGGDPYWSVEVMRRAEINKVRQASQTGAVGRVVQGGPDKGKPIPPKGPWVDWFGEMARKTVLRRHSKVLPMSGDLLDTFERDDAEEARAQGAARLLEVIEEKPIALPRGEDLDHDPETGEVTERDSRGFTEVDEETARRLDAGEQDDGEDEAQSEEKPKVDKARAIAEGLVKRIAKDFAKAKTEAQRQNVHKDYATAIAGLERQYPDLYAQATAHFALNDDSAEPQGQAEAAAETVAAIDGPLDEGDDDQPSWAAPLAGLRKKLATASTIAAVDGVERDWLNLVRPAVDDEGAVISFERDINARKRELREQQEG